MKPPTLARLEIEITGLCELRLVCHGRFGEPQVKEGSEAWSMLNRLFGDTDRYELTGTLDEIKVRYLMQCADNSLTQAETAARLGVSDRSVRAWAQGRDDIVFASKRSFDPDAKALALRLVSEGMPVVNVAAAIGASTSLVYSWRKEMYDRRPAANSGDGARIHLAPHAHEAYEDRALRPQLEMRYKERCIVGRRVAARERRRQDGRATSRPRAKLTEQNVLTIRTLYPKKTTTELANEFGVSQSTIASIVTFRTWKNVG